MVAVVDVEAEAEISREQDRVAHCKIPDRKNPKTSQIEHEEHSVFWPVRSLYLRLE